MCFQSFWLIPFKHWNRNRFYVFHCSHIYLPNPRFLFQSLLVWYQFEGRFNGNFVTWFDMPPAVPVQLLISMVIQLRQLLQLLATPLTGVETNVPTRPFGRWWHVLRWHVFPLAFRCACMFVHVLWYMLDECHHCSNYALDCGHFHRIEITCCW